PPPPGLHLTGGAPGGGPRNPSLIRDLVTGQVIRPA
ncbi:tRNA threonylcarbamoyladenosine biosynthesis protein RimN, partial [Pseudomonas aeruginosa]|nr:tRNA threonylcarbamoyladenosine biosynthesis protein RimN [Pseudomonas aeruginosa]